MVVSLTSVRVSQEGRDRICEVSINRLTVEVNGLDQSISLTWPKILLLTGIIVQNDVKDALPNRILLWLQLCRALESLSSTE